MKRVTLIRFLWKGLYILAVNLCSLVMFVSMVRPDRGHPPIAAAIIVKLYAMILGGVITVSELGRRILNRKWAAFLRFHGIRAVLSGWIAATAFVPMNQEDDVSPEEQAFGYILLSLAALQLVAQLTCLDYFFTQRQATRVDLERQSTRKHQRHVEVPDQYLADDDPAGAPAAGSTRDQAVDSDPDDDANDRQRLSSIPPSSV